MDQGTESLILVGISVVVIVVNVISLKVFFKRLKKISGDIK